LRVSMGIRKKGTQLGAVEYHARVVQMGAIELLDKTEIPD